MSWTEGKVLALIADKHKAPRWATFTHLRNGTGYARRTTRTADAVAMALWPSMGLEIHGFEVKVSKSDLAREMKEPEKAEEIARFCDRWWVVVPEAIVPDLTGWPPAWGLLAASEKGLRTVREAEKLTAQAPDRLFVASLLRNASGQRPREDLSTLVDHKAAEIARGAIERVERSREEAVQRERRRADVAHEELRAFTNAVGLGLPWSVEAAERLGTEVREALRVVHGTANAAQRLKDVSKALDLAHEHVREALAGAAKATSAEVTPP